MKKIPKRLIEVDEDTMDIASLAKEHAEEQNQKIVRPPSVGRSLAAWSKLKRKAQEEEDWRQRLAKVWDKKKSS